jgi:hypothetical protein
MAEAITTQDLSRTLLKAVKEVYEIRYEGHVADR